LETIRRHDADEAANAVREILSRARSFLAYCEPLLIEEAVTAA